MKKKESHFLTVGEFVLNTESRKLYTAEKQEIGLSLTVFTLLKFLIDNQNQVVSKEKIIAHVWKDKTVVDANVNQNLKKLRDLLGDSATHPKYIETVPGEGFRFIANSKQYKSIPEDSYLYSSSAKVFYVLLFLSLVAASIYLSNTNNGTQQSIIKELHPLTTLKGLEHYPVLTSNKKYLLFNHKNKGSWDIYLKPLNKESYHAIVNSDDDERFPVISEDQSKMIYYLSGKNICGLFIRDINLDTLSVGEPEAIRLCQKTPERLRAEWINKNEIFISINDDLSSPASIYHYNLKTKLQDLISKPDSKGFGDYALKYSIKKEKLAYIRNIGWSSSEIWVYDLKKKSHEKIKSTSLMLRGLDWNDDGWIFFQSGNKEISKISDDGNNEEIVARFPSNIYIPFVINDQSIGVGIGDYLVTDVSLFDIKSKQHETIISSRFNDYFGAGGSDFVAFASNRSGDPQVWLRDNQGNDIQLTQFEKSYEIKWLSASLKGDLIMYNKSGHVNIIDKDGSMIFNSENYSNHVHNNPVFDIENDRFMYSTQYNGEWNIEFRKLSSPGVRAIMFNGSSARPCSHADCIYYIKEKDPYLYRYTPRGNTSARVTQIGFLRDADEWDVYDENNILYIEKGEEINRIIKHDLTTGNKTTLLESNAKMFSFDKSNNRIYTNLVSQGDIDVMYFDL